MFFESIQYSWAMFILRDMLHDVISQADFMQIGVVALIMNRQPILMVKASNKTKRMVIRLNFWEEYKFLKQKL